MPTIISRAETGLPARVTNINRITLRPLLLPNRGLIVAHYTGAKVKYHGMTQAEVQKVIRSIHLWKANEYNYVIDWAGRVYDFAGEHQGAHCKGFNETGYGVLFLNGVGETMTHAELCSFHFLFGMLLWSGRVQQNPWVVGHQEIAATACPADVMNHIDAMREYNPILHASAA
jgi:hypothetical protein